MTGNNVSHAQERNNVAPGSSPKPERMVTPCSPEALGRGFQVRNLRQLLWRTVLIHRGGLGQVQWRRGKETNKTELSPFSGVESVRKSNCKSPKRPQGRSRCRTTFLIVTGLFRQPRWRLGSGAWRPFWGRCIFTSFFG